MDQISTLDDRAPLISIIIPTYNRASLIRETLDSIKAQTSPHWECIVVDDGSSDNTESVVAEYSAGDSRFSFYKRDREPKGAPTCRNIGLHHAKGEWVIFLDSDDLLTKNCCCIFTKDLELFNKTDAFIFRTNSFIDIPDDAQVCFQPDLVEDDLGSFIVGNIIWQTAGVVWNKNLVEKIGGFREGLSRGQDWDFAVRALLHLPRIKKSPDVISLHRVSKRSDRIACLQLDISTHEELFNACLNIIDLAILYNHSWKIKKNIISGAFYRLALIAWIGEIKKAKKLLTELNANKKINILMYYKMKISISAIYIISKVVIKFKKIAKKMASLDGIQRNFP